MYTPYDHSFSRQVTANCQKYQAELFCTLKTAGCNLHQPIKVLYKVRHIELTDTEIIKKVLAGEQGLFAELVQRYQSYVFTLVLRFTDNREDAEEIGQDVFVKAYRSLADFRGDAKFSTWLFT